MTVFLDTSVSLRVLFHEPNPLKLWAKWDKAYSSSLWRVEALRTVDRLRLSGDLSDREVADAIREFEKLDLFLTHDLQLGTAARSVGFDVPGIE